MNKLSLCIIFFILIPVAYNAGLQDGIKRGKNLNSTAKKVANASKFKVSKDSLKGNPEDKIFDALTYYNIKYQDIAYAIAIKETDGFKKSTNNLFGLYDADHKKFLQFNNWYESVLMYKNSIEDKFNAEDWYYEYLKEVLKSKNKNYIKEIQKIAIQNKGMD